MKDLSLDFRILDAGLTQLLCSLSVKVNECVDKVGNTCTDV